MQNKNAAYKCLIKNSKKLISDDRASIALWDGGVERKIFTVQKTSYFFHCRISHSNRVRLVRRYRPACGNKLAVFERPRWRSKRKKKRALTLVWWRRIPWTLSVILSEFRTPVVVGEKFAVQNPNECLCKIGRLRSKSTCTLRVRVIDQTFFDRNSKGTS